MKHVVVDVGKYSIIIKCNVPFFSSDKSKLYVNEKYFIVSAFPFVVAEFISLFL